MAAKDGSGETGTRGYRPDNERESAGHESGTEGYRASRGDRRPAVPPKFVRDGLQIWPLRGRSEFESDDEFWDYIDEVNRYNNGLPPKVAEQDPPPRTTARGGCRQLGLKLALPDYELLEAMAEARRLKPTTLARTLLVRALVTERNQGS